ncbi:DUF5105 domain-containing protein [Lactococcus raffinolactis]|uniref:DUF5105 domain-containing protein n=1 Tax=Pseudolactococcus raffinolactis TaxID=1366 RepID=UPI0014367104|nr:DUF5105 domain-containing protein [Lactococcus raffinolactis]QIW50627.1 DUF5105 domain-containing protein [Lactococcus raffinolactis]
MKKKIGIIALALTSALLLTGCGGSGAKKDDAKTSAAKAAGLEVNLKKGYYALSDKKETSDDTAYIALEVNIKNTSDKKIFLSQENFAMYQKGDDEKIKPERTYDFATSYDYKDTLFTELSEGKSATGTLVFEVKKGKTYQLAVSKTSLSVTQKAEDVEIPVDLKKYDKTKSDFTQAEDALAAYIDVVFLNKTNDAYDKLVSTNKDEAIETAKKAFVKDFKDSFMDFRPSDEQASAAYNQFREVQAKRSSYKLTTVVFYDSKALVNVKLEALSRNNIRKIVSDYETAYLDATDDYDYKKAEEDAFNKYKEILDKSDLVESSDKLNISMTKKDGKWDIKMKNVDGSQNEYLLESYIGHVMDY